MDKYISYYRVSTQKQGNSGLGIEAQKSAVINFINSDDELIDEFTDIESGKKNDRPNLLKAIELCKLHGAILLIAKLDRLSRNAAFIFMLRDSLVKFKCVDMPDANSVTIGIMAVLAQDERERTSQRTKDALAQLKHQGKKLGSPQNLNFEAREKGLLKRRLNASENENNMKATALIMALHSQGKTFYKITQELNASGFRTRRNKEFQQKQVMVLFERFQTHQRRISPN